MKRLQKSIFWITWDYYLAQEKKLGWLLPIKNLDKIPTHKPAAETTEIAKLKKSKLKLQQEFMNEIIADEKDMNNEIFLFLSYFKYQNPSFSVKNAINAKQNKNEKTVNNVNNGLIDLRNDIKRKIRKK